MQIDIALDLIAGHHHEHSRSSDWWLKEAANFESLVGTSSNDLNLNFTYTDSANNKEKKGRGSSFQLCLPHYKMGAITSNELLGLDELILFSFYSRNTSRYRSVTDLGANIGLHSAILASLGYTVTSYEPDPHHSACAKQFLDNVISAADRVTWHEAAVVPRGSGNSVDFVRVLGNTTSSHVFGAKAPYGELETFRVSADEIDYAITGADLVKMDVEGLEAELLTSLFDRPNNALHAPDIMLEVGNPSNAQRIFSLSQDLGLMLFSQATNWSEVTQLDQMPSSYKDGSLFLTTNGFMPW